MTVKTARRRGLQGRGNTEIDSNITISKHDTIIEVSSGVFIDVRGNEYEVSATSKDIGVSDQDRTIGVWIYYNESGNVDVHIGEEEPQNVIIRIVPPDWFEVPSNTMDLETVEMYSYSWIDIHPKIIEEKGYGPLQHNDLQHLKRDGVELEISDFGPIQVPENAQDRVTVREVE